MLKRETKVPALPKALLDQATAADAASREAAAWELGRYPTSQTIEQLATMLGDDNRNVVYSATRSLIGIGSEAVVRAMLLQLRTENAALRNLAVEILAGIGESAIPQVSELTSDPDHDIRKFTIDIFAMIGSPKAEETLIRALFDDNTNVAVTAAEALGRAGTRQSIPHLVNCLSREPWLKCAALKSLGTLGGEEALQAIMSLGPKEESIVLYAAVAALGNLGETRTIAYLVQLLEICDNLEAPIIQAINSIISHSYNTALRTIEGKIAPQQLLDLLSHSNREVKKSAVVLLGMLREQTAVPALTKLYSEENLDLLEALDEALINIHPLDIAPLLEIMTSRKSSASVSRASVGLLARLGIREALPAVFSLMEDADHSLRLAIIEKLPEFNDTRALPRLHDLLNDTSPAIRKAALQAVVRFKDPSSIIPLIQLTGDSELEITRVAAASLTQFELSGEIAKITEMLHSLQEKEVVFGLGMIPAVLVTDFEQLIKVLARDPRPQIREAAILKTGLLDHNWARPLIQSVLNDRETGVRRAAIRALEECNFGEADKMLLEIAARDDEDWNRYEAVQAIGRLHLRSCISALINLFESSSELVQAAIIDVLGALGDDSCRELILKAQNADSKLLNDAATEALACLCSHRPTQI